MNEQDWKEARDEVSALARKFSEGPRARALAAAALMYGVATMVANGDYETLIAALFQGMEMGFEVEAENDPA